MNNDTESVSGFFTLSSGCKLTARCPRCHSSHISYYKVRRDGLKGISSNSQGLTPVCLDCGKNLPIQQSLTAKNAPPKNKLLTNRKF